MGNIIDRRRVLITGASRGIGRAVAELFSDNGFSLYLVCHNDVEDLKDLPGTHFAGDIGDYSFVEKLHEETGEIDILINNAGIPYYGLLQEMEPSEWDRVIRTNLTSVFNTCRVYVPGMVRRGSGKIINISSQWGNAGASMEAAYSASKGGVNALTKSLAKELALSGIQVNAIACGVIDTDMNAHLSQDERVSLISEIPADRMGRPGEVAELCLMLSGANEYLTGQVIALDGGWI